MFLCPILDAPRRLWFEIARAVADEAGAAAWWDAKVVAGPPSTLTLAAALFGHRAYGRPRLFVPLSVLRDNLAAAFLLAFLPFVREHSHVIHFLQYGVPPSSSSRRHGPLL